MTFADVCIAVAFLIPYLSVSYAKYLSRDSFNNADPRNEQVYKGKAQRAYAAQLNGFETFPFFAIAVIFAEFRSTPQMLINVLAAAYIVLRLLYVILYVENKPTYRSLIFTLGFVISLTLFFLPLIIR